MIHFKRNLSILLLCIAGGLFAEDYKKAYKAASTDDERMSIINSIVESKDKQSAKVLIDALKEGESNQLRSHAALGLGTLGLGVDELQIAYDKDDGRVRESCMSALADIGAAKSTSYFEKGIKEKNETIRLEALRGLSKVANSSHARILKDGLGWTSKDARLYALAGLGKIQAKEEWRSIQSYCTDSNAEITIACLQAAGKIKNEDFAE